MITGICVSLYIVVGGGTKWSGALPLLRAHIGRIGTIGENVCFMESALHYLNAVSEDRPEATKALIAAYFEAFPGATADARELSLKSSEIVRAKMNGLDPITFALDGNTLNIYARYNRDEVPMGNDHDALTHAIELLLVGAEVTVTVKDEQVHGPLTQKELLKRTIAFAMEHDRIGDAGRLMEMLTALEP